MQKNTQNLSLCQNLSKASRIQKCKPPHREEKSKKEAEEERVMIIVAVAMNVVHQMNENNTSGLHTILEKVAQQKAKTAKLLQMLNSNKKRDNNKNN